MYTLYVLISYIKNVFIVRVAVMMEYTYLFKQHFFFFFLMIRRPPSSTLFPYPTLFRSDRLGRSRRRVLLVRAECAPLPVDDSGGTHERVAEASRGVRIEIVEHRPDLVEQPTGPVKPGVELLEVHEVVVHGLGSLEVTRPQQRGQPRGRALRVGPRRPGGRTGRVGVEEELDPPRVGRRILIQLAHEVERSGEWLAVEDPAALVPEMLRRRKVPAPAGPRTATAPV